MTWDHGIARARTLAKENPAARAMLSFYADLAETQQSLRPLADGVSRHADGDFAARINLEAASDAAAALLGWLQHAAPEPLARASANASRLGRAEWLDLMRRRMRHLDIDEPLGFIVDALLQPFAAEAARAHRRGPSSPGSGGVPHTPHGAGGHHACCPVCGGPPVVAALREAGQGAKRTLVCGLCFTEWDVLRTWCPACDEHRFDALPVYTADTVEHVRIDACDTCQVYLKTVDLTKNGHAIPIVDDLATVSLDLWARDAGYRRLCPNLLRL